MAEMEYGRKIELDNDLVRFKLTQAHDSLDQARSLIAANMDRDLIANTLFYSLYYAVLALLQKKGVPAATMSVTIGLFEREFVQTGMVDWRYSQALHRAFELRTSCSCADRTAVTRGDVEELLPLAEEFLRTAGAIISTDHERPPDRP